MSILLARFSLFKKKGEKREVLRPEFANPFVPWSSSVLVCVRVKRGSDRCSSFKQPSAPSSMAWYHLSLSPDPPPPSKLGAHGRLQPACTGLLIGNRAAAHLLIESRLGPWGRAVNQAPHGIKSWRLTGHCKSRAANSGSVYPSVLELDLSVCVCGCGVVCVSMFHVPCLPVPFHVRTRTQC